MVKKMNQSQRALRIMIFEEKLIWSQKASKTMISLKRIYFVLEGPEQQ